MRFFKKENAQQKLWLSFGSWLQFEPVATQQGVIAVGKPEILRELDAAIAQGRGALTEISQQEYEELKKKPLQTFSPKWREELDFSKLPAKSTTTALALSTHTEADVAAQPNPNGAVPNYAPIQPGQIPRPKTLPPGVA